jgi:hypothetical protein
VYFEKKLSSKLLVCSCIRFRGIYVEDRSEFRKVYAEMKRVRLELKSIEHTLNDLADAMLPSEKMGSKEEKELREIDEEMA